MRVWQLEDQKVGLWGAGREAACAYRVLSATAPPRSFTVVSDRAPSALERDSFSGGQVPVSFSHGEEGLDALSRCEVIIRSPGISRYRPEIAALERAGVTFTTATNLWMAEHPDERVVAVTGTKGKSTTAAILAHLARADGAQVVLAGNIGVPLLEHLRPAEPVALWVLELSSYQAADLERSPFAAIVLNLYPEHIDWHGSHERYYEDKLNVLRDRERVRAILNARSERLRSLRPPVKRASWFGSEEGYDAVGEEVRYRGATVIRPADSPLRGEHNALNVCAALTALEVVGMLPADPARALSGFQPLPHRLQLVHSMGELSYVDDGISTTPESTIAALTALAGRRIALIAGGYDRGQDYGELAATILASDVTAVIGLPDTGERLLAAIRATAGSRHVPALLQVRDMEQAVEQGTRLLAGGGVVLLSPAAPSYGVYRDFQQRSEHFLAAVGAQRRDAS